MYPIQACSRTQSGTVTFTSSTTKLSTHARTLRCLTRLNQLLAPFPAVPTTACEANETLGIKIKRVGFINANGNITDQMDADVELAFEPAAFRPLKRSGFRMHHCCEHDRIDLDSMGLAHLRVKDEGKTKFGGDSGLKIRSFVKSSNQHQYEQRTHYNNYKTPATPRLQPVLDASCSSSNTPSDISTVDLNAHKHGSGTETVTETEKGTSRYENGSQCQSQSQSQEQGNCMVQSYTTDDPDGHGVYVGVREVEEGNGSYETQHRRQLAHLNNYQPKTSLFTPPLCSCTTKSSTMTTSETNASYYRNADMSTLNQDRLSGVELFLNEELPNSSKDHDAWITGTETPAAIKIMTTAPLFLPTVPPIFRPNPGQILLRNASRLCQQIEGAVESDSTRSSLSIGNLGYFEESGYYQYPWKVQDVYVDYVDFRSGNTRANPIATVLVGAGGTDDSICIAELKAAVGVLLWWYEHSNEVESAGEGETAVLILSYIGSGHGRILQAHHDGWTMVVQHSSLMTFDMGDYFAESAFVRYTAGRPVAV
ncbi:predicted protein [Aspergillus nidulans FGSC A4]|uniref:Uncharacterized protein n=1 Tax=Emericella nidulans (strain FGSC A4 / ATCC 38163 / CBS 112.46 / NRRL 194 / M139) TaxID=227321 RepID=Q5AWG2_EMENI|nr:hypothetical protein [Aspergillus nidulans FGSC A4]EAA61739.1 predicted protein [Aspergillus nidulans FGSC A4]CBF78528.1 TPA: conserved hypothetical protein [Aspergillus nidulans FGSC A4]|eukprot:XP_680637.1 predicted protein [Aspergillus nidulans FGSC A4]